MPIENPDDFLSSGLTLLNCALTDNPHCAFLRGTYNFIVGDSMAGKTYFSMQLFAEACADETFNDYKLIHDDPENGAQMDVAEIFGEQTANRITGHQVDEDGVPIPSVTVEEMYLKTKRAFKKQPCIEIVDSMDALTSLSELKKADKIDEAIDAEKDIAGIMSDGKAKANSMMLRQVLGPMQDSGSLLFIISQTRDSVGKLFSEKTRSGGKSLRFYASTELWFSVRGKIKKTVKKVEREIGNQVQITVKKNRHSSQRPTIDIPLIHDYGFDDIGSCVDFLVKNGHWKGESKIECPEFSQTPLNREKLCLLIEMKQSRQDKLKRIVGEVWNDIRSQLKPKRKKRYG